jgi:hypothetical protein
VVSFTLRLLYPLDRRLGGSQSRSGRAEKRKFLNLPELELRDPSAIQPVTSRYIDCAKLNMATDIYSKVYGGTGSEALCIVNIATGYRSVSDNTVIRQGIFTNLIHVSESYQFRSALHNSSTTSGFIEK